MIPAENAAAVFSGSPMKKPSRLAIAVFAALFGAAVPASAASLSGAGATFPQPLYQRWGADYVRATGTTLDYAPLGSAAGLAHIRRRAVDFGASDLPLPAAELQRDALVQFPAVIGGVVPVLNLPGVAADSLRLDGATLADIYLGRIRRWDDAAIAALNPGLRLPRANITVVHRSDGSGTTLLFTRYLDASSPSWAQQVGAGLERAWPVGVGGSGNEGVASLVQRTRLSIGYVEYAFAVRHRLSAARLRNRDGVFVAASPAAFAAAVGDWGAEGTGQEQLPIDRTGAAAWPLVGASFVLVSARTADTAARRRALDFFRWAEREDAAATRELGYVAVQPAALRRLYAPDD